MSFTVAEGDQYNVQVVNVTSHNITIQWEDPAPEESFRIEAVPFYVTGYEVSKQYSLSNPSNKVCTLV